MMRAAGLSGSFKAMLHRLTACAEYIAGPEIGVDALSTQIWKFAQAEKACGLFEGQILTRILQLIRFLADAGRQFP